ncbi:MAG: N-acetyltransferase [Planctomycetia bacterium]|nr:N-acetyltransferase [Planctomycetia bacterium]
MTFKVRPEGPENVLAIRAVNRAAFGRDDEGKLVDVLRAEGFARLSLVADEEGQVVGHILFSDLGIVGQGSTVAALALAPMAVVPSRQRQGIGSALVREGLRRLVDQGQRIVLVVGHRAYYTRFGFSAQLAKKLTSKYAGDSFMALELAAGALEGVTGEVKYARPFVGF